MAAFHQEVSLEGLLKRNAQLEILTQIARSITIAMSFEEMMEGVAEKLKGVISYDLLNLCILEDGYLVVESSAPPEAPALKKGTVLHPDYSWSWEVLRKRECSIRSDIASDGHVSAKGLLEIGIRSILIVPLIARSGAIGTLNVGSRNVGAYTEEDAVFLQQVADLLALIIENSHLYREELTLRREAEERNLQLEILNYVARRFTVEAALEEAFAGLGEKLRRVVAFDYLWLWMLREGSPCLRAAFPDFRVFALASPLDPEFSCAARVARERTSVLRHRVGRDSYSFPEDAELLAAGMSSAVMVPVIVKGEVIGVLGVAQREAFAYSGRELGFLQQLADQLGLCLENMRLYRREKKLKQEWEETFRAVRDGLLVVDRGFRIVRFNEAVAELAGSLAGHPGSPPEPGQKCYAYFWRRQQPCRSCPARSVFAAGGSASQRFHLPPGRVWDITVYPVPGEGGGIGEVVISLRDVTERVNLEAQLVQSAKLVAIGELAAGVAHELNSPLTAVIGNAFLLQRDFSRLPEERRNSLLEDIRKCGVRCKKIVDNLRTFARQEGYVWEEVDLNEVVADALSLLGHQLEKAGVRLVQDLHPGLPRVRGSRQHLEQVLVNFLLNARDALKGREGAEVVVATGRRRKEVYVAVKDNGPGIDSGLREKIFSPFFTTKKEGTGLGLAVSKNIAEVHGGRIEVESLPGSGSTFVLVLPLPA